MHAWTILLVVVALALPVSAGAQTAPSPPCVAGSPAALQLAGLPSRAVVGRAYEVSLAANPAGDDSAIVDRLGATIGVTDSTGRGWSARYEYVRGLKQAFSVGLDGAPFTVTATYVEQAGDGTCTRTLSASLPVLRRILAVVNCRRGVLAPSSGIVFRCSNRAFRLRALRWRGWNADTAVARGELVSSSGRVRSARVTLSAPRECSALNAFIYTRMIVRSDRRTHRVPIACPIL